MSRPKRKAIPERVKRIVLERQHHECSCKCGTTVGRGLPVEFQHAPPLAIREVNAAGTDYMPAQHDPDYIFAMVPECHRKETYHPRSKATSLNSDRHAIDKTKRLESIRLGTAKVKHKRDIPSRKLQSGNSFAGSRNSQWKRTMSGKVVKR